MIGLQSLNAPGRQRANCFHLVEHEVVFQRSGGFNWTGSCAYDLCFNFMELTVNESIPRACSLFLRVRQ